MKKTTILNSIVVLSLLFIIFCISHLSNVIHLRTKLSELINALETHSSVSQFVTHAEKNKSDSNARYERDATKYVQQLEELQNTLTTDSQLNRMIDSLKTNLINRNYNKVHHFVNENTLLLRRHTGQISIQLDKGWLTMFVILIVACLLSLALIVFTFVLRRLLVLKNTKNIRLERKSSELEDLLKQITHDSRNQLNAILSSYRTKEGSLIDLEDKVRQLDQNLEELNSIIRIGNFKPRLEELNIKLLIEKAFLLLSDEMIRNEIEFKVEFSENNLIRSDSAMLKSIVHNLLSNSVRYYDQQKTDRFIHVTVTNRDSLLELVVEDNGIGMNEEIKSKAFELFSREDDKIAGSGIGLYLVKRMVDKLHGTIEVESRKGVGTRLKILIPLKH